MLANHGVGSPDARAAAVPRAWPRQRRPLVACLGCRLRLLPRFDHATAGKNFSTSVPTVFFGVPTMFVRMLEHHEEAARRIGRAARLLESGSAPLAPAVFAEFERRFGHRLLERYGISETLMLLGNPYAGERRPVPRGTRFRASRCGLSIAPGRMSLTAKRRAANDRRRSVWATGTGPT